MEARSLRSVMPAVNVEQGVGEEPISSSDIRSMDQKY
jgi:hypothetical protein